MDIPLPRQICRRPSAAQMRALLCELEVHPQLACGRTKGQGGRDAFWQRISSQLNALSGSSGCTKTPKQWQKFWSDKKSTVKKHVEARKAEGLSVSASAFNDIELKIINLVETFKNPVDNEDGPSKSPLANSSKKTKAVSPSDEQVTVLLDELESRPYLAHVKQDRKHISAWNTIADKLNSINGCVKSRMEWMNYWSSKKRYVKRMLDAERVASENDGTDINSKFNHIEHRIIAIIESPIDEFQSPVSPCLEEEYLEYDSDVDDETVLSEIRSSSLMSVEKKILKMKPDTSIMKPTVQGIQKTKIKKKRTQLFTSEQMLHKLLRMEEKRVEIQKTLSIALDDIYNSMHRQEQATKELARVLVKIYDR